ncbi:MAG: hypothetical protein GWN14_13035 [candidate division Zixibacteria bacterium]|nr:hypothetical protein [candidate division Zixibacteria bacterium]
MVENISQKIPEFLRAHPGENVAVLLRPCEISALDKIDHRLGLDRKNIFVISADCLGTYPADEYSWRADRKGSQESLTDESLKFSKLGGISQYRYRSACQLCKNPIANKGDLNINIAGIPVRHQIMVTTYNGINQHINMSEITNGPISEEILVHHDQVCEKMVYRNQQTRERLSKALVENTELNLETLAEQLNECVDCQTCMEVCPICNVFGFSRTEDGSISRDVVAEWMVECVGCGMCEQSCVQHKPLAAIFSVVHDQLASIEH